MLIRFWGVRGSIPVPIDSAAVAAKIEKALNGARGVDLSDPGAVKAYVASLPLEIRGTSGGNTSCVEVIAGGQHLIMDAGTGLRVLGNHLMKGPFGRGEGTAHFFISHTHWDHIQGFPFFVPAYIPGNHFIIHSPKKDIQERFIIQQIDQDMFPMKLDSMGARLEFVPLTPAGINLDGVLVDCLSLHHPGGSWAFRIKCEGKTLVYATDGEYQNLSPQAFKPYLEFFSQADTLIFDAMYTFSEAVTKQGWGHSTSLTGVDLAIKTGLKKLVLFHHEPNYSDESLKEILDKTKSYFRLVREEGDLEIVLAVEGLELTI
ncbi:MAG: MBL fold metallo-hydrolase [Pseudomonadota bacterium]